MFTGLVQDVGLIKAIRAEGESVHLELQTRLAEDLIAGDSLAVNGVCLTVTTVGGGLAVATAIPETLARTTLGSLSAGRRVNLEPALRLGDRMGGHIVQGHVDGIGQLVAIQERGLSREITVEAVPDVVRYVVVKGSVAIDGISLTVAGVTEFSFVVALIPHTQAVTTLNERRVGDRVNLEVDILAKYIERLIGQARGQRSSHLTEAYLREQGF
jgi:riboflavin synthase